VWSALPLTLTSRSKVLCFMGKAKHVSRPAELTSPDVAGVARQASKRQRVLTGESLTRYGFSRRDSIYECQRPTQGQVIKFNNEPYYVMEVQH
jgi:hypothetical protein